MARLIGMARKRLVYNTPDQITSLLAWFKADSLSLNDGDAVSSWLDSGSGANDATNSGAAGTKPTHKAGIINGKPVVRFDGGDGLTVANEPNFDIETYTVFIVGTWVSGTGAIMGKSTTGFSDGRRRKIQFRFDNSTTFKILAGSDANAASLTITNAANPGIYVYRTAGNSSHTFTLNGTDTASTTTLAESSANYNDASFLIGSAFGIGTEGYNGDIAEIIIYSRTLTDDEALGVQNYLSSKYNISGVNIGGYPRTATSNRLATKDYGNMVRTVAASTHSVTWTNTPFNVPTVVSACVWLKLRATTSSNFDVPFGFGNTRWFFIFNSTTNRPTFNVNTGSEKSSGYITSAMSLFKTYLFCGTYDPNGGTNNLTIRVYDEAGTLYGSNQSTQTGTMNSSAQALTFGRDPARAFNMSVDGDEIHVYSRVLSTAEQDGLAKGIEPDVSGLELWAKCDESSGNLADSSGNARTGTNNNTCTFVSSFRKPRTLIT